MSHEGAARVWHVHPRVVIFPCRTNYRVSYVKCWYIRMKYISILVLQYNNYTLFSISSRWKWLCVKAQKSLKSNKVDNQSVVNASIQALTYIHVHTDEQTTQKIAMPLVSSHIHWMGAGNGWRHKNNGTEQASKFYHRTPTAMCASVACMSARDTSTYQAISSTAVFFSCYVSHIGKHNTECHREKSRYWQQGKVPPEHRQLE